MRSAYHLAMRTRDLLLVLPLLAATLFAQEPAAPATAPAVAPPALDRREPGPAQVASFLEDWRDEKRQRDVPVKIWHPAGDGPFPVIVFSHGLGGTRDGYAYLGKHWASWGYVCVHVQHLGSDDSVWRGNARPMEAMQGAATDLGNLLGRPKDITFAIDELERRNALEGWPLEGKLDLAKVGVAGHSFGAYTALCSAGRVLVAPLGNLRYEVADPRVKAAIAMSPQGHEREKANGTWSQFATPVFHMTGTKDTSPISGDSKPEERRIPFDAIDEAEQFLLVLEGAEHMAFSDAGFGTGRRDPHHWPLILAGSTAFWDAELKGDGKARAWLRDGGFAGMLGKQGVFEHKEPVVAAVPAAGK